MLRIPVRHYTGLVVVDCIVAVLWAKMWDLLAQSSRHTLVEKPLAPLDHLASRGNWAEAAGGQIPRTQSYLQTLLLVCLGRKQAVLAREAARACTDTRLGTEGNSWVVCTGLHHMGLEMRTATDNQMVAGTNLAPGSLDARDMSCMGIREVLVEQVEQMDLPVH